MGPAFPVRCRHANWAASCHPTDREEEAALQESLKKPPREILVFVGIMFQERLAGVETITLLRAVMVETKRFPHLAQFAFDGLIGSHQAALDAFLADNPKAGALSEMRRRKLSADFLNDLLGLDVYRTFWA